MRQIQDIQREIRAAQRALKDDSRTDTINARNWKQKALRLTIRHETIMTLAYELEAARDATQH